MALFWSKKPKAEKNYEAEKAKVAPTRVGRGPVRGANATSPAGTRAERATVASRQAAPSGRFDDSSDVIVRPHITEKSGMLSQGGVYTFVVSAKANKPLVAKAVKSLYKVTPVKVAFTRLPAKTVWARGKWGTVSGIRKAVVTVKKGDKIEFA